MHGGAKHGIGERSLDRVRGYLARSLWPAFESFVGIGLPVFGRVTLTHRPLAGLRGPLALVEDLLNRSGAILSGAI